MKTLTNVAWLKNNTTQKIMHILGQDVVRVVGGCVRDSLLGIPVTDVDMATTLLPEIVMEKMIQAGFKVISVGIAYGTVKVFVEESSHSKSFEITTLRQDIETTGRHARVIFGTNWREDAQRRDFTINALYADINGLIYDPLSCGLKDMALKRVVFIGDATKRITEDYLRVLRFFRFHFLLCASDGLSECDREGIEACIKAVEERKGFTLLSAERIQQEFLKILCLSHAGIAFEKMAQIGLLNILLPHAEQFNRLSHLIELDRQESFSRDPFLRLVSVFSFEKIDIKKIVNDLRLSRQQERRLCRIMSVIGEIDDHMDDRIRRKKLYHLGSHIFVDCCKLLWATDYLQHNHVQHKGDAWRKHIFESQIWRKPVFPLTGQMVKSFGIKESPAIGYVLDASEQYWIENDFTDDIDSIIEYARSVNA